MDPKAKWPRKVGSTVPIGDGSRLWTGLDVIEGLIASVSELVSEARRDDVAVVIGCSPWLTDPALVDVLTTTCSCIVTTKPQRRISSEIERLQRDGKAVLKFWLRGLDNVGVVDEQGRRPTEWMGGDSFEAFDGHAVPLGPVRFAGWRRPRSTAHDFPIVHAKVALLGYQRSEWFDTGYGETVKFGFEATAAWVSSANFTRQSRVSAEFGMLTRDDKLVYGVESFLMDVLRVSEPYSEITPEDPTPDLVEAYVWEPSSADLQYMREQDAEYMIREYGEDWDNQT